MTRAAIVNRATSSPAFHAVRRDPELQRLLGEVQRRELDPLTAVREILEKVFRMSPDGDNANRPDTR